MEEDWDLEPIYDERMAPLMTHIVAICDENKIPIAEMERMDFGGAIKALKERRRVARDGWNGKGMWLFLATDIGVNAADRRHVLPSICMLTAQGNILVGWLASQTDILAEDWYSL